LFFALFPSAPLAMHVATVLSRELMVANQML